MKTSHRLLCVIAVMAAAAGLVTGCSTTVEGNPIAGTSPVTSADTATGTTDAGGTDTTSTQPGLGSIVLPAPPTSTSTSAPDTGTGRTSESTTSSSGPASSSSPPPAPSTTTVGPTSTATPATTTRSSSSAPTSKSGGSGTDPFAGATSVNASDFPGTVTPVGFSTPSGNINCGFQPTKTPSVVCQIGQHTYPNPPQDCHGAGSPGGAITLSAGGPAEFFCAGDLESGGPTLGYGSMISIEGLQCVSRENGVTCRDTATGNGFRLASGSYELVNGGKTTSAFAAASTGSALSAFAGTWGGHGRTLDFNPAGRGTVTYRSYVWCSDSPKPPCDSMKGNQIVAGGKLTVTLTSASGATATGTITASNDPAYPTGTHVAATISGYNLTLSIWADAPFCAPDTPSSQWNCGA